MIDVTVGMIYPGRGAHTAADYGHPAHRGFARAIGAKDIVLSRSGTLGARADTIVDDLISSAVTPLPDCDVFVTENDSALYVTPRLSHQYPDATIVHLAASDRLLGWVDVPADLESPEKTLYKRAIKRLDQSLIRRFLNQHCDGVIAVSDYVADCLRAFGSDTLPVRVVNPYVQPDVFDALGTVEPNLSEDTAVTVSQWRDHKGIDLLVDAWPRIREHHPDAELRIVGPGHPARYAETVGVTLRGRVASLASEFASASLYVHPAYIEPFGVSVVEAMRAGLPAIVTETTGAKSVVEAVDPSFVVEPTRAGLTDAIVDYFSSSPTFRQNRSDSSRLHSRPYTETRQTKRFAEQFRSLLAEIG